MSYVHGLNDEQFLALVQRRAQVDFEEAERAARATLATLAERISEGRARSIAERLPPGAREWLAKGGDAEGFDVDELIRRVAEREGVDIESAQEHALAVFTALGRVLEPRDLEGLAAELSRDYEPLIAAAAKQPPPLEILSFEEFVHRVAERAGIDATLARRASEAVVETLAERISRGEVFDLATQLAAELRPALLRGDARSGGAAQRMSLDEFVRRVAEREGVTPEEAREHARAVFATLRDAVTEKEFHDIDAQLPDEYRLIMARA